MKVASIIISYNRKELLEKCIESILKGSIVPEIIVVDNASSDGTQEFIRVKFPSVKLIELNENLGPAGGAEEGQKYAFKEDYDAVWMLDDDVKIDKYSLEKLIKRFDILSSLFGDKIFCTSVAYGDENFKKPLFNLLRYNSITGITKRIDEKEYSKEFFPYDVGPMHGLFISKKVMQEVGFFNGKFFGWYDDTEYVLRAKKRGFQGYAITDSKIFHPTEYRKRVKIFGKNITFIAGRPIRMYFGTRNNIIAQRSFLPWFNFYFIFLPLFISRRFLSIIFFYENKGIFIKNFFKGIIDGIKMQGRF